MSAQPSAEAPSSPHTVSFMVLPAEVRIQIYSYLLHLPPISATAGGPPDDDAESRVSAGILRASRLIHAEAAPVLYGGNTFVAHPSLLADFPRLRPWYGPVCAAAVLPRIRRFHLTLRLDCDLPFDRRRAAAAFSGAEELHVRVVRTAFLGAGKDNLGTLEDVRGVQRLTIAGSTTGFESYVDWLARLMQSPSGTKALPLAPVGDDTAAQAIAMT
ncbi:hypothetical protein IF1G_01441 [Cordyceps javanica]|uniref:Uncharacterized protein n=1 Tax=Cordyceps javanica TaxID=43265 RepID=A0A545VBX3_9HYPO|nr:hypothetical protein IF1G_01441 [Cordyceps javanica]TQW11097.1 hypothetical protein IF2G_02039 [Cordyceps javanica]